MLLMCRLSWMPFLHDILGGFVIKGNRSSPSVPLSCTELTLTDKLFIDYLRRLEDKVQVTLYPYRLG